MGGKLFHMGPLGSAAVIKVITNMLAFIHLVADGEALMLAKRGGLDLAQAWKAIAASSGTSFVHETEGQLILNGSYDIAFTMDLALKDLGFAMKFGEEFGVPLDLATRTRDTFLKGREAYGGAAQSTRSSSCSKMRSAPICARRVFRPGLNEVQGSPSRLSSCPDLIKRGLGIFFTPHKRRWPGRCPAMTRMCWCTQKFGWPRR